MAHSKQINSKYRKNFIYYFQINRNTNANPPDSIKCGDIQIQRESKVKYLGIILHEHLNWDEHTNEICKKN